MKTIKWGIIGAGNIATKFATALSSMKDTELLAIASRNIKKAEEFADRFQIKKAYGSYEELVKDEEVDVVYIATPHTEHKANGALCIINNKAVLCEKPFTINTEESKYLIDLAAKHDVFLMEAMWTKFLPVTNAVKSWIKDKKIGEVKHIRASFGYNTPYDINSRLYNPDTGGGALLDVGVYPITYACYLLDKLPDNIESSAIIGKSNVDEQNVIALHFDNGVLGNLSSAISAHTGDDALIIGDEGKIHIPNFWNAQKALVYNNEGQIVDSVEIPFMANGYEYEAEEVNNCLRQGKKQSSINSLNDTLDIMTIMDELRQQWGLKYPQDIK
ncbi:MAG TPA: Gfo/Idh/MocA family oxidoreductase [Clostridiales bacterium]|nr:Gfo/Idh/MocA family oxidoreductase [Clostridiales bacterium]